MKEDVKLKQLPPVYTGKWAYATDRSKLSKRHGATSVGKVHPSFPDYIFLKVL